jgi:hypothetical protein
MKIGGYRLDKGAQSHFLSRAMSITRKAADVTHEPALGIDLRGSNRGPAGEGGEAAYAAGQSLDQTSPRRFLSASSQAVSGW